MPHSTAPHATEAHADGPITTLNPALEAPAHGNQAGGHLGGGPAAWEAPPAACDGHRDASAEITAKAIPYCGDATDPDRITGYRLHTGPLHRAAGKLGFQMFDGEARMSALVERNHMLVNALRELSDVADQINAEQDTQLSPEKDKYPYDMPDDWCAPVEIADGVWRRLNSAIVEAQSALKATGGAA